jgi:hypothetical protein
MRDMSLTTEEHDIQRLMQHIEVLIDLKKVAAEPSLYWASIPIDAVWSIRSNYETTVCPLVRRFAKSNTPPWDGADHSTPPCDGSPTVKDLLDIIERRLQNGCVIEDLFHKKSGQPNRQRTSSQSGIFKAEAVHRFASALLTAGINQPSDLRDAAKLKRAETLVKKIPGQGTGITFTYFLMLSGEGQFVKSDTHIRRFVSDALGIPWSNLVSADRAARLLSEAARRFAVNFPGLTPAKLDHAVWDDQKLRTQPYRDVAGGGSQGREGISERPFDSTGCQRGAKARTEVRA